VRRQARHAAWRDSEHGGTSSFTRLQRARPLQDYDPSFAPRAEATLSIPPIKVEDAQEENSFRRPKLTIGHQLHAILFHSWINVLFAFIPTGFVVNYTHRGAITVFCINFIAIIPSAVLLALALDEIGFRVGDTLQGLLNMTFR